jgi:hypothetical protein
MTDNKLGVTTPSGVAYTDEARARPSVRARLIARLKAHSFDRMLAVGAPARAGSALAAHATRLTSTAEREAIARTLRRAVSDAHGTSAFVMSSRIPLHVPNILDAEETIDALTLRLHSPRPVNARGMARLRQVLSDGSGPLYRFGRGDLAGRLGAALAAL